MKTLKNLLTALAVVIAIAGAFGSKKNTVTGWAHNDTEQEQPCEGVSVSDDCQVRISGAICTFTFGITPKNVYESDSDCDSNNSDNLLRLP